MNLTREEAISIIVERSIPKNGCLILTTENWNKWREGYPTIRWKGKEMTVARFVCGTKGKLVTRHKCHNKACIDPLHLMIGTSEDNWNDNKYSPFKMPIHYGNNESEYVVT